MTLLAIFLALTSAGVLFSLWFNLIYLRRGPAPQRVKSHSGPSPEQTTPPVLALPQAHPPIVYHTVVAPTAAEGSLYSRLVELQREIAELEDVKLSLENEVEDLRDTEEFARRDLRSLREEVLVEMGRAFEDHTTMLRNTTEETIMTLNAVIERYQTSLEDAADDILDAVAEAEPVAQDPPKTSWEHIVDDN